MVHWCISWVHRFIELIHWCMEPIHIYDVNKSVFSYISIHNLTIFHCFGVDVFSILILLHDLIYTNKLSWTIDYYTFIYIHICHTSKHLKSIEYTYICISQLFLWKLSLLLFLVIEVDDPKSLKYPKETNLHMKVRRLAIFLKNWLIFYLYLD